VGPTRTAKRAPTRDRQLVGRIRELEREVEQLEAIIDNAPLAIYLKNAEHKYLFVNREYERLAQTARAGIIGKNDFDIFPSPVAQLFREQDEEVAARSESVDFRETIPLPDGVHSFITSKFPIHAEGGSLRGVAGVCTDITQLLEAQARLEQAQSELVAEQRSSTIGELSAVIAHEVRNPLCVIFNSVASLRRTLPVQEESSMLLDVIHEEADRLNHMVSALVDMARPAELDVSATDVEDLADDAIEAARARFDGPNEVHLVVPAPLPPVALDARRLRQALVNLVMNALQSQRRTRPVMVLVATRDDHIEFRVIDDGEGVPSELAERVFEPFFTTRASGAGLGLAVVRQVAKAHRGTAKLVPTPEGGATFVLTLPLSSKASPHSR
jgi:PAS domain S-box-containing protein